MSTHEQGPRRLGAHVQGTSTLFAAFTERASCAVRLYDVDGRANATHQMEPRGGGLFEATIPGVGHGARYKFVLDGEEYPDPYARYLPQGVHGPATVYASKFTFRSGTGHTRPLSEHVIYELHVGTFTPEGTFRSVIAKLPELARLGVTALELMPVAAFPSSRGWGYDGVALFAPLAAYGTPDELRELVDEAHGAGLSVLLDVVYNHLGPAGNYLAAYHSGYFTREVQNAWGDAPDFGHPQMRSLVLANARYWLEEFRFDGLRLDATHAIVDSSPRHVLEELTELAHGLEPKRLLIAEDDRNEPTLVSAVGFDALWADDFHHQLRVTLTGERDGYYAAYEPTIEELARVIERGWLYEGQPYKTHGKPRGAPATELAACNLVYCIQNHDQIGNRAFGERLIADIGVDAYCLASMLLLYLPMTPLLFMGQEWAASTPFLYFTDHEPELGKLITKGRSEEFKHFRAFAEPSTRAKIPDPQELSTFERSRLRWEERERDPHARVLALYHDLLALRRTDAVMRVSSREGLCADVPSPKLLRVRRFSSGEERVLYANFGREPVSFDDLDLPAEYTTLLVSSTNDAGEHLPPLSAAIFATQAVGVSS